MLCSVIKHSRKWREHSRSREKDSPAARVHPTLLSCSRHFLACFITEQSTVLAFLFVKYLTDYVTYGPYVSCASSECIFCLVVSQLSIRDVLSSPTLHYKLYYLRASGYTWASALSGWLLSRTGGAYSCQFRIGVCRKGSLTIRVLVNTKKKPSHLDHNSKKGRIKDREPQKPYPISRHIPV